MFASSGGGHACFARTVKKDLRLLTLMKHYRAVANDCFVDGGRMPMRRMLPTVIG
jgi:hypothetical protein